MFKLVVTAKRRPGMTMEEFRNYYETRHAKLVQSLSPGILRYKRTYITPLKGLSPEGEPPFDCMTETWLDSEEELLKQFGAVMADPKKMEMLTKDEENLFDRATIRFYASVECESGLGK